MLDLIMRGITKYSNSHMYDIYAVLSGTIAFIIVMGIKVLSGKKINRFIMCISLVVLGAIIFVISSNITQQIYVDAHAGKGIGSILYAGGIAFAEYVVIDMISNRTINLLVIAAIFAIALYINTYFCRMVATHYKICYGIKIGVALICALGLIRTVLDLEKEKK